MASCAGDSASNGRRPSLSEIFAAEPLVDDLGPRYNVAPTDEALVVVQREERRGLTAYRWGLIPHWAKDARSGSRMFNARAETLTTSPAFRDAFKRKRCLVPVDGVLRVEARGHAPPAVPDHRAPTAGRSRSPGCGRAGGPGDRARSDARSRSSPPRRTTRWPTSTTGCRSSCPRTPGTAGWTRTRPISASCWVSSRRPTRSSSNPGRVAPGERRPQRRTGAVRADLNPRASSVGSGAGRRHRAWPPPARRDLRTRSPAHARRASGRATGSSGRVIGRLGATGGHGPRSGSPHAQRSGVDRDAHHGRVVDVGRGPGPRSRSGSAARVRHPQPSSREASRIRSPSRPSSGAWRCEPESRRIATCPTPPRARSWSTASAAGSSPIRPTSWTVPPEAAAASAIQRGEAVGDDPAGRASRPTGRSDDDDHPGRVPAGGRGSSVSRSDEPLPPIRCHC